LLGFGVDGFVESLSGAVMIWRFSRAAAEQPECDEHRERIAVRLVSISLFVLAGYVLYESLERLYYREPPERGLAAIIIATVSIVAMPILYAAKRRTAAAIRSNSLAADAKQTLGCIMLSVALLIGSGTHYVFGVWQADPLAGGLIAAFLMREGYKAWVERDLCCC
jgi:divalent metal cation (Fe/Co/Zn/Cd) transporter